MVESQTIGYKPEQQPAAKTDAYAHVGREMRRFRLAQGLTQAQAAQIIGVSPQQYQKYEEAHSKCSLNYLITLADHYGVDVGVFLPGRVAQTAAARLDEGPPMAEEADLLARLVSSFMRLSDPGEKLRLVQLVEAISAANAKRRQGDSSE